MENLSVVTSSTQYAVTIEECKHFLRIETSATADNDLIEDFIRIASDQAENYMRRTIMPTVYRLVLDRFPPSSTAPIQLPKPPLSSNTSGVSITFLEDTSAYNSTTLFSTSVNSTRFVVDTNVRPLPVIYPAYTTNDWPSSYTEERKDVVTVQYTAGWKNRSLVPPPIKQFIKMTVASMYEHREPIYIGTSWGQMRNLPHFSYEGLLDRYVIAEVN